jgi:benzoyl-CoA reductase subunit D
MARALEVPLDELGPLALQSARAVPMNAQCVVFAESEVVSMIHSNVPRPDMARAVHDAIAGRVAAMARRVGGDPPVVLMGGMARNTGFVDSLGRALEQELSIPPEPQHCGALGAALAAARRKRGSR